MARARQTRRRKHKGGTQAGTVKARGRRGTRTRSRAEVRGSTEQRRQERLLRLPTWKTAVQRGGIAAAALFALMVIVFKAKVSSALPLALLAALIYVPAFHFTDTLLYRARMRRKERERRQHEAAE